MSDTEGVIALLKLLADPAATRERLDQLEKARQGAEQARAEAKAHAEQAAADKDAAFQQAHRAGLLMRQHEEREKVQSAREETLNAKERDIAQREAALVETVDQHDAHHSARSDDLTRRENAVAAREAKLATDLQAYETDRQALDRRIDAIKAAAAVA